MTRIKIELPEKFIFKTIMPVRVYDVNYAGHLSNDRVLSICHDARVQFLNSLGYSELDTEGAGIIMNDAAIQYKTEGFIGDELLVELNVIDFTKVGCDVVYKITNNKSTNVIALAKTGIVFFDFKSKKLLPVPAKFREKVESLS